MKNKALSILVLLCGSVLAGCSSSDHSGSYSTVYYSSGYYDPWWYDHDDYWIYYYPGCCDNGDEYKEKLEEWWNGLDEDQQQSIKDKVEDWKDDDMSANIDNMKRQLDDHWQSLPDEQKQEIRTQWENRPEHIEPATLQGKAVKEKVQQRKALPETKIQRPVARPNVQIPKARPNIQPRPRLPRR
ncbi:hypothetical protein AB8I23_002108 [Vibrio alginolyticus]|uniref:hypothetical protein n=1 Tax=Vibrio alginolyticus TaxID=663 RepID=UPI00215D1500|nr:hypothetical protein [Vibrio alginolyticus]EKL9830107.1 hypothetical protein [Vibrio alginolyticus]MCR9491870.1 hypothetical protein [Vibrio alginolyticus]